MLGVKNKDSELTSFRCLHISYLVPVFFLLTLNMLIPTRNVLKLLNVRLILGRCLCFLKGLMAQNPKTNRILYSGKVSLCSLYRCKSLLIKTFSWCHIVLHIIIPMPFILKGPINFSRKSRDFNFIWTSVIVIDIVLVL